MAMTPLRKRLVTLSDIIDNAKALARRLADLDETHPDYTKLSGRLAFNLREIADESGSILSTLPSKKGT